MSQAVENYFSLAPLAAVLISPVAAILILLSSRRPNLRETWTILAALGKFAVVSSMLPVVLSGLHPEITLFDIVPGVSLALKADPLGLSFALSASLLWIFTSFYSIGYMRALKEHNQTRYFASFAVCLSATMGIAFAANLLTFLIFFEMLTIATYPLVIHAESAAAISAGRKYLAFLLTGGVALLLAVGLTQMMAGTLNFSAGGFLSGTIGQAHLLALFVLFLVGVGTKAGLIPLHSWLPAAMIAPTPVSALLHAVAVVKAGVFGFARVTGFVFGPALAADIGATTLTAVAASTTIVIASLLAMAQDNLKRRLAYSTVAHLSYIILGTVLFAPAAWLGGLFYIAAHAAMKITLFFCAGAIYVKTGRENVSELDGIGKQMPLTMAAFAIGSLGLAGLPPLGGFISKWFLIQGAVESGQLMLLAALLPSGLLSAGYLFPIVIRAFFKSSNDFSKFDDAPAPYGDFSFVYGCLGSSPGNLSRRDLSLLLPLFRGCRECSQGSCALRRLPLALIFSGLVIAAAADAWFLSAEQHGEFWWSHVYGFFSLFGFFGCLAIILVAERILGPWLLRNENYYHRKPLS